MSAVGLMLAISFVVPGSNATARIGALVLDGDTREPVPAVAVRCQFERLKDAEFDEQVQRTDETGRTAFSGITRAGHVIVRLGEPPKGYHASTYRFSKWWNKWDAQEVFQPDNLVTTQYLSKIVNPIPLIVCEKYCLHSEPQFNKNGNELRFDLMKGDWLPPNGVGEIADVVFKKFPRDAEGRQVVTAEFPGAGNGLQVIANPGLGLPYLRVAPESGYRPQYEMWYQKERSSWEREKVLAFRIRTKLDKDGKPVAGHYGKIYDGLEMLDPECCTGARCIRMRYYLNPKSLERNLEWDGKTNCCPDPGRAAYSGDTRP